VAIVSAPSNNELLTSNVLAYGLLVVSGAIIPTERLGAFAWIGDMLPMRHGIAAVRAVLSGQPWLYNALTEAAVGVGWAVVGWAVLRWRISRARTRATEDFG
jgi:ABC-2 type transport system permease protein